MPDYDALYADADEMRDHWWWRPGWHVGTRFYAWHLTLDDQDELHRLVDDVQRELSDIPTLDPVPRQWRHITMTGLGHVQDVPEQLRDAAVDHLRQALSGFGSIDAVYEQVSIFPEAVAVRPNVPEQFTRLQSLAQQATTQVVPGADTPNTRFRAHVTTHYRNARTRPERAIRSRDEAAWTPARSTFTKIDLIEMHRDRRMYEWEVVSSVNFS